MTLWSCLLYIIANVTGMFLYWLYQKQRAQKQYQEQCVHVEKVNDINDTSGSILITSNFQRQHRKKDSQYSLLSLLGLSYNGYRTFYAFEDRFSNFDEVGRACRKAGLETCGLIIGVDFSASNEWQGRKTFSGQNLHKVLPGKVLNPYQKVISIIGRTIESLDEDNLIPAYGFGDSLTMGKSVFSFKEKDGIESPCNGFTEVLDYYSDIASSVTLGGPTNFAPIIHKAVQIVRNLKRYHILIIIADGQVIEQVSTVKAIVEASQHPLSIILVGVGDGPWTAMEHFDNCLPERSFDNFQFVNFHAVTNKCRKNPEASFALHAMMEIPDQYKTIKSLGYLEENISLDDTVLAHDTSPSKLKHSKIPQKNSKRRSETFN
uniref:VWFA domain-containing protein n=1 Tax=Arion vulgaris TaxID=1028688 RepID=A0A0B6Z520_9EUPU